jgi:hypothetical protein
MLLFGRTRSRRGLASALIGEIAAVLDGMERFEEVRKLEEMEIGAEENLDELGAFTLPRFSVYESNADRLNLFDAAIQRQIAYFFTSAGSLAGHLRSRRPKRNRRSYANSTQSMRKRKSTAFRNWATICYMICESSYPKNSLRQYPELDDTPRL